MVLTFVVARVHERKPIPQHLVAELRDLSRRIRDPRLGAALALLVPAGPDEFVPRDRNAFLGLIDSLRYDVHRWIEEEWGLKEIRVEKFSDRDLLVACLTPAFWVRRAEEEREDGVIRREVEVAAEDGGGLIVVEDDQRSKTRTVSIEITARYECDFPQVPFSRATSRSTEAMTCVRTSGGTRNATRPRRTRRHSWSARSICAQLAPGLLRLERKN